MTMEDGLVLDGNFRRFRGLFLWKLYR